MIVYIRFRILSIFFKVIFYYILGIFMEFGIMLIVEFFGFLFVLNSFRIINLDDIFYYYVFFEGV